MRKTNLFARVIGSAAAVALGTSALATVYPGNGVAAGGGNQAAAITSVSMTNDATNLYVTINLDPTADLTSNYFVLYELGIQDNGTGAGAGSTSLVNPYGEAIGISTGMYDWAALYLYYSGSTEVSGADFYHSADGSTLPSSRTGGLATSFVGTGSPSVSMTIPLSSLGPAGLGAGSTFNFDVWTTYGGSAQSAYDALDNTMTPVIATPWNNPTYDSATAPGTTFANTTYTVAPVPEPASIAIVSLGGIFAFRRSSQRR